MAEHLCATKVNNLYFASDTPFRDTIGAEIFNQGNEIETSVQFIHSEDWVYSVKSGVRICCSYVDHCFIEAFRTCVYSRQCMGQPWYFFVICQDGISLCVFDPTYLIIMCVSSSLFEKVWWFYHQCVCVSMSICLLFVWVFV